jgi:hypothetical protein
MMLSLYDHADQALGFETAQVYAGGRGADVCNDREFGAGAGAIVHQAKEHPCTRRLADRGSYPAGSKVGCIHCLIINEV